MSLSVEPNTSTTTAKPTTPARQIPFFNYPALVKEQEAEVRARMDDVLKRGAFIMQKDVREFEANLAKFLGVKYVFGVANGTDGLIIALRAAGLQPGDEVIMPSHTYIATAASVKLLGGEPVLVECGADHMVDPQAMEKAITPKTKFLMPVHINGRTCKMDQIQAIAEKHNLQIIEDAAQGLGSKYKGRFAGTFGKAAMFSFYPAKVLGCFGDGGALVTNDDQMAEKIFLLRDHGRNADGVMVTWGYNSRLDNLHAAVLDAKLKHYDGVMARRRAIAAMYQKGLGDLKELTLPPAPDASPDHYDIYQNYEIEADRRDELKKYLSDNGVGTLIQWGGSAVHMFKELGFTVKLPITERMTARFIMLPMSMAISDEDVAYIINTIRRFYGHA